MTAPAPDADRAGPAVDAQPFLRIDGDATPDEVAALLAALTAVRARSSASAPSSAPAPLSRWRDRRAALRRVPAAGPDAWRASAWPSSSSWPS